MQCSLKAFLNRITTNELAFSKLVDQVLGLFAKMWDTLLREQQKVVANRKWCTVSAQA